MAVRGSELHVTDAGTPRLASDNDASTRVPVGRAFPVVVAGLVIGASEVVIATSFAALIFSGDLSVHLPAGIGLSLVAAIVILTACALRSSAPGVVSSVQDVSAAALALIAAGAAAGLPAAADETFLTVVLAIGLATMITGAVFFALGSLRLGDLIRYLPFPVVGGFLGGTGLLLIQGAFEVLAGFPLTIGAVPSLVEASVLARWLPGAAFAVLLVVLTRRLGHPLLIPLSLVGGTGLFFVALLGLGVPIAEAEAAGWLLGPVPTAGLWQPWTLEALGAANWPAVTSVMGDVVILVVLSAIGLLLNASGIELELRRDVDLDRELRVAGAANILAGAGGGIAGYQALSLTSLARRMNASSRLVGVIAAGMCVVALLFGGTALSLFPRVVVGGLLLFVGLTFLVEWVLDTWPRLPRSEYALLIAIVVLIGAWGFLQGIAVGLGAAATLFLVSYSRLGVIKHELTVGTYVSRVDRPAAQQEALRAHGDQVHILELQGFIFFGTANRLIERVRARARDTALPRLRFAVIDFRRVAGLDSSAVLSLTKAAALAEAEGFQLVLTGLTDRTAERLLRGGLDTERLPALVFFDDLDRGVQWCEDGLLREHESVDGPTGEAEAQWLDGDHATVLRSYLERLEIPAGHVLIEEGEAADSIYFLQSGSLTAQVSAAGGGVARLRTLGAGAVVGEITLYLPSPRTATVVSEVPSVVCRLTHASLHDMEARHPATAAALHRRLASILAQRVADNNRTIQALLD